MLMLIGLITIPHYTFPLVWVSLYLIFDSLNLLRGAPSLFTFLRSGNWRPYFSLAFGALTCGFFWEMWNFYSYPKWIYNVPFVGFWHVFEMPLLGYAGYLPFSLELFSLYHLMAGALRGKGLQTYIQLCPDRKG